MQAIPSFVEAPLSFVVAVKSAADRWITRAVMFAALVAVLSVYGFGTGSYAFPKWLAIYVVAMIAVVVGAERAMSSGRIAVMLQDLIILAALVWAALSLAWSFDPLQGVLGITNAVALLAVFWFARSWRGIDEILPWAICAVWIALLALDFYGTEDPRFNAGFGNKGFSAEFYLVSAPFLAFLMGRSFRGVLYAIVLAAGVGFLVLVNESKLEYLVAWALAITAMWWLGKKFIVALLVLVPVYAIFFASSLGMAPAFLERAELWLNTGAMWLSAPIFGNGLGSFNYLYPLFQEAHIAVLPAATMLYEASLFAGAAHQDSLQLLAEIGAIGFALVVAVVLFTLYGWGRSVSQEIRTRYQHHRTIAGLRLVPRIELAALVSLGIALLLSQSGFALQKPAVAFLACIALAILSRRLRGTVFVIPLKRAAKALIVVAMVVLVGGYAAFSARAYTGFVYFAVQKKFESVPLPIRFKIAAQSVDFFPLGSIPRLQVWLRLAQVMESMPGVQFNPEAVDEVYALAREASPAFTASLVNRMTYLINSGRWLDEAEESNAIVETLRSTSSLRPEAWIVIAGYEAVSGHPTEARISLDKASGMARSEEERAAIKQIGQIIEANP